MVAVVSITFRQPRIPNIMGDEGRGEKGRGANVLDIQTEHTYIQTY